MYSETSKLHLIEEVLKIKNEDVLKEIEKIVEKNKGKAKSDKKTNIYDFVGILSKKETAEMKKAIAETCETIDENDWK